MYNFYSEIILGVCFGYDSRMPKHTPGIFVRGGICLPVTPGCSVLELLGERVCCPLAAVPWRK